MFDATKYLDNYHRRLALFEVINRDGWPPPPMVKSAEIILGDICNARCVFCCAHQSIGNWISLSAVKKKIDEAKFKNYDMIIFSGGEPTIYPHFFEALKYSSKLNFPIIEIMTNGIKLANPEFAKKAVSFGLTMAKIAIHGCNESTHDSLTGINGSFIKALKAIDNLNRLKIYPSTNIAINALNYKQLPLYCKFFVKQLDLTGFCFYFGFYSGKMKNNIDLQLSYSDFMPYLRLSLDYLRVNNIRIDWRFLGNFVPCLLPECSNVMIDWGADYKNKNNDIVSGGKTIPVFEMYNERKRKMKKCDNCIYGKICYGVDRDYLIKYGENEFMPIKKIKKQFFNPVYW